MKLKILIAAGGSGGHLFPAQQLSELLLRDGDVELFFAGHKLSQTPFFEREKIPFAEISSAPLKEVFPFISSLWKGFWQSIRLMRSYAPDVVVGFGSFHTFPVLLAAAILRKKIVLFEANCIVGKVNRFFTPFSDRVAFQFPTLKKDAKAVFVPFLPWVSKEIPTSRAARRFFGLDEEVFTILVFGGSQGAAFLNLAFSLAAGRLSERTVFQVIHLTGNEGGEVKAAYEKLGIRAVVKPFEKEMVFAYAASDIAVCRSGAGTTAELIHFQKPALLIPFPHAAEDHQKRNAQFLSDAIGGARWIDQSEAAPERLVFEIEELQKDLERKKAALEKAFVENREQEPLSAWVRRIGEQK